jgi:hypothetical protein
MQLGPGGRELGMGHRLGQACVRAVPRLEQEYGHRPVLLVPRALDRAQEVRGKAVQLARLGRIVHDGDRATQREQDSRQLAVLELRPQLVKPIPQRVPVGIVDQQRQHPLSRRPTRTGDRQRHSVDGRHG